MADGANVVGTQEAARQLGVSVRTVQLWVEKGMLEAWKTPGGHRRILRSSINSVLRARQPEAHNGDPRAVRVLIVEDDLTMQSYYRALFDILRPEAELTMASDGYEALLVLGKLSPELMVVDVDMPGMDGITMLKRIAAKNLVPGVKIMVVTGLSAEQVQSRGGVPAGIEVHAKPLSVDSLSRLLGELSAQAGAGRPAAGSLR